VGGVALVSFRGFELKLCLELLLGLSLALTGGALSPGARAAELPALQATPIEYLCIRDSCGAGFFFFPRTDTYLRAGALVLGEVSTRDPSFSIIGPLFYANDVPQLGTGCEPLPVEYSNARNGKSFCGANDIVALLSYSATFGDGYSTMLSFEDQASRGAVIGSPIARTKDAPTDASGISLTSPQAQPAGARIPEIVGNIRLDQPWGAMQFTGGAHQLRANTSTAGAPAGPSAAYAFPASASNPYGFAVQGGLQLNMDYLSPSDKLWLQAAYDNSAFGYGSGNDFGYADGSMNQDRSIGSGSRSEPYGTGRTPQAGSGCVFTWSGACEQQWGGDIAGADKQHWLPILSSAIYGSYLDVHYPANALADIGGTVGISDPKETHAATNVVWPPLKGFDVGAEFMYVHLNQTRPAGGFAPDPMLTSNGLPAFPPNTNIYKGRLRVERAF
jgi:Porin subfamily